MLLWIPYQLEHCIKPESLNLNAGNKEGKICDILDFAAV